MAMVTLTSTCNTNPSQTLPFEKHQICSSPKINNQDEHHYLARKKEEDGEIGVFGAEKYFNGGIDQRDHSPRIITKTDAKKLEFVKPEVVISREPVIKPVITTNQGRSSSIRSELSWNSQTALLQSVMKNPPRQKPSNNKVNGKSFLSSLAGCKCYCSDRNSVDIEEVVQVGEISFKRPSNGDNKVVQGKQNKKAGISTKSLSVPEPLIKEELFTFPTMNSAVGLRPIKGRIPQGDADEIGRKLLEVFGSPVVRRRNKSLNLEGRFKMLSWDASATPKVVEQTDHSKGNNNYNIDTESDASSDLFEIESLTGKGANNPAFLGRQASDAAASGCVTPTTCYAPSEASIEWRMVTASAADFSVMSDYEDRRPSISLPSPIKTFLATNNNGKTKHNREYQRQLSGGLLGCNNQKAVKVAGDAYRTNDQKAGFDTRLCRVSDSYMPAARYQADQTNQTPQILPTRSLPHSISPQASHLLCIQ